MCFCNIWAITNFRHLIGMHAKDNLKQSLLSYIFDFVKLSDGKQVSKSH